MLKMTTHMALYDMESELTEVGGNGREIEQHLIGAQDHPRTLR